MGGGPDAGEALTGTRPGRGTNHWGCFRQRSRGTRCTMSPGDVVTGGRPPVRVLIEDVPPACRRPVSLARTAGWSPGATGVPCVAQVGRHEPTYAGRGPVPRLVLEAADPARALRGVGLGDLAGVRQTRRPLPPEPA